MPPKASSSRRLFAVRTKFRKKPRAPGYGLRVAVVFRHDVKGISSMHTISNIKLSNRFQIRKVKRTFDPYLHGYISTSHHVTYIDLALTTFRFGSKPVDCERYTVYIVIHHAVLNGCDPTHGISASDLLLIPQPFHIPCPPHIAFILRRWRGHSLMDSCTVLLCCGVPRSAT